MEKTAMIDFMQFCSTDEMRSRIQLPFKKNGNVYATDGQIAIIAKENLWDGKINENDNVPNIDRVVQPPQNIKNWIFVPALLDCSECNNTGVIKRICKVCKGSGKHQCRCGNEHDCFLCAENDGEVLKDFCRCNPMIFGKMVQRKYIFMISSLPNVVCGITDDFEDLLYFKFDGGYGAICKISTPIK